MQAKNSWTSSLLAIPCLSLVLAACDDDDGDGLVPGRGEFSAEMDENQEVPPPISGLRVRVTVTNRAPDRGTFLGPVWVGFHDGVFDMHDLGSPASSLVPNGGLERMAEDGDLERLREAFADQGSGTIQGQVGGVLGPEPGPIAPGETVTGVFELDPNAPENRFFSFAAKILPSNDAYLANDDPVAHPMFNLAGTFVAADFTVMGTAALDAGTETNDELPGNTAFFGQSVPDTGVVEGGVVSVHPGFLPPGGGGILDDPRFVSADFTVPGYQFLTIRFQPLTVDPQARGAALVDLEAGDTRVDFTVTATGLSGPATAAHFHEAPPGQPGPIVLSITDTIDVNTGGSFRARGSLAAPDGFAAALRAGLIYINVHTALNPGGEVRGQVLAQEAFTGRLDLDQQVPAPVRGKGVRVTVRNRAPERGTFQSAVWCGFHDGGFDTHDPGMRADAFFPATKALERLGEDGNPGPLMAEFSGHGSGRIQGTLPGILGPEPGPLAPGEAVTRVFRVDPLATGSRFFGYGSMVLPSNDAFVANGDALAHPMYDASGNFVATSFGVAGTAATDLGTEVNDELPLNTAFFGQTTADTGVQQEGLVGPHAGFLPLGSGGILDDLRFAAADFRAVGYEFLSFDFQEVEPDEPASGLVIARLAEAETRLDFSVVATGLSGPASGMHFHQARAGIAGPILIDVSPRIEVNENGVVRARGSEQVTSVFVEALRRGDIYLGVPTALNPSGEARAQLAVSRAPQ